MSQKADLAIENFRGGMNCAQAVLTAFCETYGVAREDALALASGLGAGLRVGEVCGAASGAAMVAGLKYGQRTVGDEAARLNCNEKTAQVMQEFCTRNTLMTCRDILSSDTTTPPDVARKDVCIAAIRNAATILEEQGY